MGDQRCSDVVLGAQRVAGTERCLGTARQQDAHEVGRLAGHMHGRGDANTLEGLLLFEAFFE